MKLKVQGSLKGGGGGAGGGDEESAAQGGGGAGGGDEESAAQGGGAAGGGDQERPAKASPKKKPKAGDTPQKQAFISRFMSPNKCMPVSEQKQQSPS
eukprot:6225404-Karenia_brevis.AAC.1